MNPASSKSLTWLRSSIHKLAMIKAVRILSPSVTSIFIFGTITFLINHQSPHVWTSVATEAGRVFLLTLFGTALLEGLFFRFRTISFIKTPGLLTVVCTALINLTAALILHYWADTQHLLMTAGVGQLIGISYASLYIISLKKLFPASQTQES